MLSFFSPCELSEVLEKEERLVMVACMEKKFFRIQKEILEYVSRLYGEKLKICLLDADSLKFMDEKFDICGIPSFVLCLHGQKRDVLLGRVEDKDMKAFIQRNLEKLQREP